MISKRIISIDLKHIHTDKAFLKYLYKQLQFPDYFGFNYDALDECMRDFSWFPESEIIIYFKGLENLTHHPELYQKIKHSLEFSQKYWRNESNNKQVSISF